MIAKKNELIKYLLEQDNDLLFELKLYKHKRNRSQNNKYWKLVNELALKLQMSVEKVHYQLLKDYSQRYEIVIPENVELRGIRYYEKIGAFYRENTKFNRYLVYVPSHELKTNEFANLLSGVVEECRNVGIEVRE